MTRCASPDLAQVLFGPRGLEAELIEAAREGRAGEVRFLLREGADVHAAEGDALRMAALWNQARTVEILLEAGARPADLDADDRRFITENGNARIIALLALDAEAPRAPAIEDESALEACEPCTP